MKKFTYPSGTARITVSVVCDSVGERPVDQPERLVDFWHDIIAQQPDYEPDKERVVVILLNTRLRPYAWNLVSLGNVSESTAHPREVFRPAIAGNAYAIALMHNHPSGCPDPSRADEKVTRRIVEAGTILGIRLMDHVIVGADRKYYSFREAGMVP